MFEPALAAWERGVTPNPDVPCNREVKFGALMDQVISAPSELLATGIAYLHTGYRRTDFQLR